jgi:hypothetical protein
MDPQFEAVSASLKQPCYKTFWRVTVPVRLPAVLDIGIYLFVNAMTTVSAVVFLWAPGTEQAGLGRWIDRRTQAWAPPVAHSRQRSCFARGRGGDLPMNATALLKKQHKDVKGLFEEVLEAEDPESRRQLCEQIGQELQVHTKIEEEIFYPAVRELGDKAEDMILEAFEEHHVVDLVLAELPRIDPEDERFHAKMTVLHELVEHHVKEEEKEMFKLAQKLGRTELTELGERMEARAEELKGEDRAAA